MDNPRELAVRLLTDCEKKRTYSNISLKNALDKHELSDADARLLYALVNGVLERRITIDFYLTHFVKSGLKKLSPHLLNLLRTGVYQILYLDKVPDSAACDECVKLAKKIGDKRLSGFVNGVLRSISRGRESLPQPDIKNLTEYLSVIYSVPSWIVELWQKNYPDKVEDILKSKFFEQNNFIRINNLKTDFASLSEILKIDNAELTEFKDNSAILKYSGNIEKLTAFQNGLFHVQGISSQTCAEVLEPKAGERILDMCSAPGGKAFTMSEIASGKATVIAMDIHSNRSELIESGAERLGLSESIIVVTADATGEIGSGQYDKILCDVPCSGLGVIKKKPDVIFKTSDEIKSLPEIQQKILENAANHIKKGGIILYSTCTLNPLENEFVIKKFVENHQNFQLIDISKHIDESIYCIKYKECVTILPDNHYDGFFISALQRVD